VSSVSSVSSVVPIAVQLEPTAISALSDLADKRSQPLTIGSPPASV
jgi:hypothetical protein